MIRSRDQPHRSALAVRHQRRPRLAQLLLPISELPGRRFGRAPRTLPGCEIAILKLRRGQAALPTGRTRGIEPRKLFNQHSDRPAVDDAVVQDQNENVIVDAKAQQPRAQQGCTCYIEWRPRLLLDEQLCLVEQQRVDAVARGRHRARKLFHRKAKVDGGDRRNARHGPSANPCKRRAQTVMPAHDFSQTPLESPDVERALQSPGVGQTELRQARQLPLDAEHVLLDDGDRLRTVGFEASEVRHAVGRVARDVDALGKRLDRRCLE